MIAGPHGTRVTSLPADAESMDLTSTYRMLKSEDGQVIAEGGPGNNDQVVLSVDPCSRATC